MIRFKRGIQTTSPSGNTVFAPSKHKRVWLTRPLIPIMDPRTMAGESHSTRVVLNNWALWILGAAFIYRIYVCFQVPLVTTDVLRHLGYASHALDGNFSIYETLARDFSPEVWTAAWSERPYVYPPVTLLFFYSFAVFHLGIFWVKLVLTLIDVVSASLFYRRISKLAAVLFFCAPVSVWYGSHEGQFEALQTLLIILNVLAVQRRSWGWSGFLFAISIQIKLFGLFIAPWMAYVIWRCAEGQDSISQDLSKLALGLVLGFLPFLPYYIQSPALLLVPLTRGSRLSYNPFAWNFFDTAPFHWNPRWLVYWNAVFTYAPLLLLTLMLLRAWKSKRTGMAYFPLTSFWALVKSANTAEFWYSMTSPAFTFCFSRQKVLICLLLLFHFMQGLRSAVLISGRPFGHMEIRQTRFSMQLCMFHCDLQRLGTSRRNTPGNGPKGTSTHQ